MLLLLLQGIPPHKLINVHHPHYEQTTNNNVIETIKDVMKEVNNEEESIFDSIIKTVKEELKKI